MDTVSVIKDSFEKWYNTNNSKDEQVTVAINYSDTQILQIKAYHKIVIEMHIIKVTNGVASVTPFIKIEENYNHGVTTEEEAKENMMRKLLYKLYEKVRES